MTVVRGDLHTLVVEQTSVARYLALSGTADGFTVTPEDGDRHFEGISFPGVVQVPAVIYYRTRHTGRPRFSVRINSAMVTQYTFAANDPSERTWHEIIPATVAGQATLRADYNELVFAVYPDDPHGTVTFGDVVIVFTSDDTEVKVPLTLHP